MAELEREIRERDPLLAERLHAVMELMTSLRDAAARVADLEREVVAARGAGARGVGCPHRVRATARH